MHGGAKGSGTLAGNRNALRHGRYTRGLLEFQHSLRGLLRESAEKLELTQAGRQVVTVDLRNR